MTESAVTKCINSFLERVRDDFASSTCKSGSLFSAKVWAAAYKEIYDAHSNNNNDKEPAVYTLYTSTLEKFISSYVKERLCCAKNLNYVSFLNEFCNGWSRYTIAVRGLRCLFAYFDRESNINLETKAVVLFKTRVCDAFIADICDALLECVTNARSYFEGVGSSLLKKTLDALTELRTKIDTFVLLEEYRTGESQCVAADNGILQCPLVIQNEPHVLLYHKKSQRCGRFACTGDNYVIVTSDSFKEHEVDTIQLLKTGEQSPWDVKYKLDVYNVFEKHLIKTSNVLYTSKQKEWLHAMSCSDYLKEVETFMENEKTAVSLTHATTVEHLVQRMQTILLDDVAHIVLNKESGVAAMLENDYREELAKAYRMYKSNNSATETIVNIFADFVQSRLKAKVNVASANMISDMIAIHEQLGEIMTAIFGQDSKICQKVVRQAFQLFINIDHSIPMALARHCADAMRKTAKTEVTSVTLKNTVFLYGYVRDKDIFEIEYHKLLACRLLSNDSKSEQQEKEMIALLKAECGYQWCSKLEGMLKDMSISRDLGANLKNLRNTSELSVLDVTVCTQTHWPNSSLKHFTIPREVFKATELFTTYYTAQYSGRKLTWVADQGSAELKISFGSINKEFVVTPIMMFILLLFNDNESLTTSEISSMLNISTEDLKSDLLSLAHPKTGKVLTKAPMKPQLLETDVFALAKKYESKLYRNHIPVMKIGEKKQEVITNPDRPYVIDAAIVRIMKARRCLNYTELQAEVVKQLIARFLPDPKSIKQRIEHLIDQDYLARDENNYATLNYLA